MPDTHINAFYMAVDDAKAEVVLAKAKLAAAEQALEEKKKTDLAQNEPQVRPKAPTEEQPEDSAPDPEPGKGSVFSKKK